MSRRALVLALFVLVAACGKQPVKKEENKINAADLTIDGNARLSDDVVPTYYTLDLTIDPTKETFTGSSTITITVKKPTQVIHLHGEDLKIQGAAIAPVMAEFDFTPEIEVAEGSNNGIALILDRKIDAGDYTLAFQYEAPLDEVPTGLYRVKDGEGWYAYTQFEPLEARQAFPSFDEPKFKTPFKTTMRVPKGYVAATNNPTEKHDSGEMEVYTFTETKPLPTYLVAFAVGEFDIVEAEEGAIENVPFRVLTTKGKGAQAQYMLKRTPAILKTLTDYFGQPYPFEKLDVVAVPNFSAGAMENVGLVTFRERLLLLDPSNASISDRRAAVSVMAHELAHMWFGNLVTMPWWNDLWLNEAFATWMAYKVVHTTLPQLEADVDAVSSMAWVMQIDSEENTRAIRQPIENGGDVYNAFDGLTYRKGAAVILMFESFMGPDDLQKAIKAYLGAHEYGTATTQDFMDALDNVSDEKVSPHFSTFLDQPGVPLLEMETTCDKKEKKASVAIKQTRYLPAESKADKGEPWHVPFCIKFEERGQSKTYCDMIDAEEKTVELPTERCPKWIYPNAQESGYYRWSISSEEFVTLLKRYRSKLTTREKVGLYNNLNALAVAQKIDAESYVKSVIELSKESHRGLVRNTIGAAYRMEEVLDDPKMKKRFERRAKSMLTRHVQKVGYKPKKKDKVENALIRPRLLSAYGTLVNDKRTLKVAQGYAADFLADPASVPTDMGRFALNLAAKKGDQALWDTLREKLDNPPNPGARGIIISALGNFEDPELLKKSLALFTEDTLRAQDFWSITRGSYSDEKTFEVMWAWFTENYDEILAKIGSKRAPRLPGVGTGFCTEDGKKKVEEFFSKDSGRLKPGGERNLKNALERIESCMRMKTYLSPAVKGWVK